MKRWVAGGTVALTGIFSAVAAHALPANHTKAQPQPAPTSAPAADDGVTDNGVSPDLAPPAQAPQPSASSGGAVSGGS